MTNSMHVTESSEQCPYKLPIIRNKHKACLLAFSKNSLCNVFESLVEGAAAATTNVKQ